MRNHILCSRSLQYLNVHGLACLENLFHQGQCGSCAAFATVAVIETWWANLCRTHRVRTYPWHFPPPHITSVIFSYNLRNFPWPVSDLFYFFKLDSPYSSSDSLNQCLLSVSTTDIDYRCWLPMLTTSMFVGPIGYRPIPGFFFSFSYNLRNLLI